MKQDIDTVIGMAWSDKISFEEIKKITTNIDCEIKLCALIDNVQSAQKIDFRGKSINKSTDSLWYIFPWENWW